MTPFILYEIYVFVFLGKSSKSKGQGLANWPERRHDSNYFCNFLFLCISYSNPVKVRGEKFQCLGLGLDWPESRHDSNY